MIILIKKTNLTQSKSEIQPFVNPSQRLVNLTVQKCCERKIRADNTTSITIMIDKPGASFSDNILQKQNQSNKLNNILNIKNNILIFFL